MIRSAAGFRSHTEPSAARTITPSASAVNADRRRAALAVPRTWRACAFLARVCARSTLIAVRRARVPGMGCPAERTGEGRLDAFRPPLAFELHDVALDRGDHGTGRIDEGETRAQRFLAVRALHDARVVDLDGGV